MRILEALKPPPQNSFTRHFPFKHLSLLCSNFKLLAFYGLRKLTSSNKQSGLVLISDVGLCLVFSVTQLKKGSVIRREHLYSTVISLDAN